MGSLASRAQLLEVRLHSRAQLIVSEDRRQKRIRSFSRRIDLPPEQVEQLIERYYDYYEPRRPDYVAFMRFYFGIRGELCSNFKEVARSIGKHVRQADLARKAALGSLESFYKATRNT